MVVMVRTMKGSFFIQPDSKFKSRKKEECLTLLVWVILKTKPLAPVIAFQWGPGQLGLVFNILPEVKRVSFEGRVLWQLLTMVPFSPHADTSATNRLRTMDPTAVKAEYVELS